MKEREEREREREREQRDREKETERVSGISVAAGTLDAGQPMRAIATAE